MKTKAIVKIMGKEIEANIILYPNFARVLGTAYNGALIDQKNIVKVL